MRIALASGANVHSRDSQGRTPLHVAMESGRVPAIICLLDTGACTTAEDLTGYGPFCAAVRANQFQAAQVFFDRNLPMATPGATPLHALAEHGSLEHARMFVNLGFRPTEANRDGITPMTWARRRGAVALLAWFEAMR
jgi:ankyrin repeat protein